VALDEQGLTRSLRVCAIATRRELSEQALLAQGRLLMFR
jgi:hypothetical protein